MVSWSDAVRYFLSSLVVSLLPGCAPVHPITETVCISGCGDTFRHRLVLVWSHEPAVEELLFDWVRGQDAQAVDPIQVQDAIREHHLILELKPGVEEVLRHLGRLFGADRVLAATGMPRSRPPNCDVFWLQGRPSTSHDSL